MKQEDPAAKAKSEADAKKKAEDEAATKAKAEEEAKKKAEADAKAKEEAKKSVNANMAKLMITKLNPDITMDDRTYQFIIANYNLFPAMDDNQIQQAKDMADPKITYAYLEKNPAPYLDKMITFSGHVVNVEETTTKDGLTLAIVHVFTNNANSYRMLIFKSTGEILKGDMVKAVGIPIGVESFPNVSGGTTNAIFTFGSDIQKIK